MYKDILKNILKLIKKKDVKILIIYHKTTKIYYINDFIKSDEKIWL